MEKISNVQFTSAIWRTVCVIFGNIVLSNSLYDLSIYLRDTQYKKCEFLKGINDDVWFQQNNIILRPFIYRGCLGMDVYCSARSLNLVIKNLKSACIKVLRYLNTYIIQYIYIIS